MIKFSLIKIKINNLNNKEIHLKKDIFNNLQILIAK